MGAAKELLIVFNRLILLVGLMCMTIGWIVNIGSQLLSRDEEAAQRLHVFPWAALLLVAVGAVTPVIASLGISAADVESRHVRTLYFLVTLVVFTGVVAVTVATASNEPMVEVRHDVPSALPAVSGAPVR